MESIVWGDLIKSSIERVTVTWVEFNTLMVEFYNTREADNIFEFFYDKCLERY